MDVVRPLIGVDSFKVHRVAEDMIFLRNAIAAMDVAGDTGNFQRLAAIVPFHEGDRLRHISP